MDVKDLREQYSENLKEIIRLETKIRELEMENARIELKMKIHEEGVETNLERDGCVYWDELIKATKSND